MLQTNCPTVSQTVCRLQAIICQNYNSFERKLNLKMCQCNLLCKTKCVGTSVHELIWPQKPKIYPNDEIHFYSCFIFRSKVLNSQMQYFPSEDHAYMHSGWIMQFGTAIECKSHEKTPSIWFRSQRKFGVLADGLASRQALHWSYYYYMNHGCKNDDILM